MHLPAFNVERSPAALHQFIRQNPLGIFTTSIRSETHPLLQSSHIPWVVDSEFDGNTHGLGRLRGHIARQNPQAKAIIESVSASSSGSLPQLIDDVLVIFNGPVHHYVTPQFYTETKPSTGKVVPTWDYEAVQVYGKARIYFDTKSAYLGSFLTTQLHDLSQHSETSIMGYGKDENSHPWKVTDAPERYIQLMMKNIIGVEIEITSMAGRFKWSQEKPLGDRNGVINGFNDMQGVLGAQLAEKVAQRGAMFDAEKEGKKQGNKQKP
jgi:transcriptional regulator